ncbi:hypothetical protein KI688_005307 [Linnemannia hyalina]|uniref:Uncharacterized protein n=1 Tax=Linnemannia hyalina TaxID=64524 RepID=A0A9P7XKT5_9FUNG|nr:hypothetical protein KI688_005307 [Linnemannia hyalina]
MMELSDAGKTATLYCLYMDLYVNFTPSLSENLETIKFDYKDKRDKRVLNLWDITDRDSRALRHYETWRANFRQCPRGTRRTMIPLSMELAAERLSTVLREEVEDLTLLPLLVLVNKQNSPYAMTVADVKDLLGLERLPQELVWHIQGVSAMLEHSDMEPLGNTQK